MVGLSTYRCWVSCQPPEALASTDKSKTFDSCRDFSNEALSIRSKTYLTPHLATTLFMPP